MSEKAENVQRKILKDLQKAWKTIIQDPFKRLQESLAVWKETERNEGWIRTLYNSIP